MLSLSRSAGSPAFPTAITTRPQFASWPAIAVFTKGELAMLSAIRFADPSLSAPSTVTAMNLDAPSPSRTTRWASFRHTSLSARRKSAAPSSSLDETGSLPAAPVANANTVSLVEVSPSTVMQLKLASQACTSACCRKPGATAASVKMKPSMVAMSGAIMPLPLTIPATVTGRPPSVQVATAPLAKVSVVPIVVAASSHAHGAAAKAASNPASALSIGSGTPITPVEATNTSDGWQPSCAAVRAAIASTAARPRLPVKALELPALTTSPRARPSTSASRHHSTSGDGQRLLVSTPATLVPSASSTKVRSQRSQVL